MNLVFVVGFIVGLFAGLGLGSYLAGYLHGWHEVMRHEADDREAADDRQPPR